MNAAEWTIFLATWTREIAEQSTHNPNARRAIDHVYGLGAPGATDEQIAAAEARLGVSLPSSYSEFLKATNGLNQPYSYVASCGGDFWAATDVDWFAVRNAEWIEAYTGVDQALEANGVATFVHELGGALELSHDGDAAVYLLNPRAQAGDGEWEAWFFASWSPGVERFRSFADMMKARYREFRDRGGFGF
jgi:hypothetical protein